MVFAKVFMVSSLINMGSIKHGFSCEDMAVWCTELMRNIMFSRAVQPDCKDGMACTPSR